MFTANEKTYKMMIWCCEHQQHSVHVSACFRKRRFLKDFLNTQGGSISYEYKLIVPVSVLLFVIYASDISAYLWGLSWNTSREQLRNYLNNNNNNEEEVSLIYTYIAYY